MTSSAPPGGIRTPDQRLRVFVSSTLRELAPEREAVRTAVEELRLTPVMFERGARPHAPKDLYRAYLEQSQVFVGVYWQSYGMVAPGEAASGLEDEYGRAGDMPKLVYVKKPDPEIEPGLRTLLGRIRDEDAASYKKFASPEELHRLVKDDLAVLLSERFEASTASPPASSAPHALPTPVTPLVGRGREVAEVTALLRGDGGRIVTLTGPGGVGKTRLALEVGGLVRPEFPDGVVFVDLAALTAPEQVVGALVSALGVRRTPSAAAEDVKAVLAGRRLLLVMDNFEQVADAAPVVADLLSAAPGLRVLATSRRPLRIAGEREIAVPPLALPPADAPLDVEALGAWPAVRVFVDRASAVDAAFVLDAGNAEAVAEICRRLDGLPLALELAAARTKLLSPSALLDRLDNRLGLLTGGARDLPERQQALRATIAWSYDLLHPREQVLFSALGTFAGGFDLAAAQSTTGAAELMTGLGELVDASLLQSERRTGEPRFALLTTVREYALEQLRDGGQWRATHDRHAAHYLAMAELAETELRGPRQLVWLDRLEDELDNLRTAARWLLEHERFEQASRLIGSIWLFWWLRGRVDEAVGLTRRVLTGSATLSPEWRAWAQTTAGSMAFASGDLKTAEQLLRAGVASFAEAGSPRRSELPLGLLGRTLILRGELAEATRMLDDGIAVSEARGDAWELSKQLGFRGQIPLLQGDLASANEFFARALSRARETGDRLLILLSLSNSALGRPAGSAGEVLEEGLALALEAGDDASAAHFRERLGGPPADADRPDRETSGSIWLRALTAPAAGFVHEGDPRR